MRFRSNMGVSVGCVFIALIALFPLISATKCSLKRETVIAVYSATGAGGVGDNSARWTRAFFDWFSSVNPQMIVDYVVDPTEISSYYTDGCQLATGFSDLLLWVQPGGSADNFSSSLGPGGRDNILDFAARPNGHYMGTCAGFYYAAGQYVWFDKFYPEAWMPHWFPTVEGPLSAIAVYPEYAPVSLDDQRTVLYWGGPVMGLNHTKAYIPNGASLLASYESSLLTEKIGAAYIYRGEFVNALFNSAHPEAVSGSGIECKAPLPLGCITPAQQLENWKWLAGQINVLVDKTWEIPSKL